MTKNADPMKKFLNKLGNGPTRQAALDFFGKHEATAKRTGHVEFQFKPGKVTVDDVWEWAAIVGLELPNRTPKTFIAAIKRTAEAA